MAIINLRKHYYPLYTKDTFIEVPDEVAAVMEECRLYENRQEGRKSYYHVYSIDCSPGIENHAIPPAPDSPSRSCRWRCWF